jgi:exodeoxyribonuclease VII large subunit
MGTIHPSNSQSPLPDSRQILSVTQLTGLIKDVVEDSFPYLWVTGEISNFKRPSSGHCYFTLKDANAQLRAVIWRNVAAGLKFELDDSLSVVCQGSLEVYPPQGSYQLVVQQIVPQGIGALELALQQLRAKLAAEGLFDKERKRELPLFPRTIAIVTSPSGAAVHDFLQIVTRRWRDVRVIVVPVRVQGTGAAAEIAAAIDQVNQLNLPIDVLVVGRGGGSLEDLWCFNEEPVVRAIFRSRIPVVSAVGHEIDVTLADLVADVRALTPSEAAERVVPDRLEILQHLEHLHRRQVNALQSRLRQIRMRLARLETARSLARPFERVQYLSHQLDELDARLNRSIRHLVEKADRKVALQAGRLQSLSPLAVLARGYTVTFRKEDSAVVRRTQDVRAGDRLVTRLIDGQVVSQVE